jgi:cyanosortase A-associated protein
LTNPNSEPLNPEATNPEPPNQQILQPEIPPQKGRWVIVIALTGINLLLLFRSALDPLVGKPIPFKFPQNIDLASAKLVKQEAFEDAPSTRMAAQVRANTAHRYVYQLKAGANPPQDEVTIDVRYLVRTSGNVPILTMDYGKIKLKEDDFQKDIRSIPKLGYYTFFSTNERAYLSACINPRGITTVTSEHFDENLSAFAFKPEVLSAWLLGQTDIKDRRCLWTQISTPIDPATAQDQASLERTHENLKAVWLDWQQWWQDKFPRG